MARHRDLVPRVLAALLVVAGGCTEPSADSAGDPELVVERTVTDDGTPLVQNVSGSRWGAPGRLVEEVRIGGADAADEAYMLGGIAGVWSTDDRIYVLDHQIPVVRVYDATGAHLLDIGRGGEGPGEFNRPGGLVVDPDGRVLVSDEERHRVNVYSPDGRHVDTWTWSAPGIIFRAPNLSRAEGGGAWKTTFQMPEDGDFDGVKWGYVRVGPEGPGETRLEPEIPEYAPMPVRVETPSQTREFEWIVPFAPRPVLAMDGGGTWYVGDGARYRIWVLEPDGERWILERGWTPVAVQEAEAEAHLRRAEATVRRNMDFPEWRWTGPDVPPTKTAFTQIAIDTDGRIWVERPGEGIPIDGCDLEDVVDDRNEPPCWTEERFWDVFAPDGSFLGEIAIPDDFPLLPRAHIQADRVTVVQPDEVGNPMVVRYRLVAGSLQPDGP